MRLDNILNGTGFRHKLELYLIIIYCICLTYEKFPQWLLKSILMIGIISCSLVFPVFAQTNLSVSHDASPNQIWTEPFCGENLSTIYLKIAVKGNPVPIDVVLVIDSSFTMCSYDPNKDRINASKKFVNLMNFSEDRIGVIEFNLTANIKVPLTNNSNLVLGKINEIDCYYESTCIGAGLDGAINLLFDNNVNNKKFIILLSDGFDDLDTCTINKTAQAEMAKKKGIAIFPVIILSDVHNTENDPSYDEIKNIANITGGIAHFIKNSSQLEEEYLTIFNEIKKISYKNVTVKYITPSDLIYSNFSITPENNSNGNKTIFTWNEETISLGIPWEVTFDVRSNIAGIFDLGGENSEVTFDPNLNIEIKEETLIVRESNGTIGDYVWNDTNRNGLQDLDELGIPEVRVVLINGTSTNYTYTNKTGYYRFDNLCPGNYQVDVDEPLYLRPTTPNVGPDDTIDSDGPSDGGPVPVTLTDDKRHDPTIDFGYIECNSKIGDYLWIDTNLNGIQDEDGSSGIPGVRVILRGGNGISETRTNSTGYYLFENLCPGDYVVEVDNATLPPNLNPTIPNAGPDDLSDSELSPTSVTLDHGNDWNLTIDFGYIECNGRIGDYLWIDTNLNGIQDEDGSSGIPGVRVILRDGTTGLELAQNYTNATGYYLFEKLCPGDYVVEVDEATLPWYLVPTIPNTGPDDLSDSKLSPVLVTLHHGNESNLTIDFGYVECNGKIGDFLWIDQNLDSIQNLDEPGIPAVRLILRDDDRISETLTNSTGYYLFENLCPGDYIVEVDNTTLPPNLMPTIQNAGPDGSSDSELSPALVTLHHGNEWNLTIDFGYIECNGKIGDYLWIDTNLNGIQDENGLSGISGVRVILRDGTTGLELAQNYTNSTGYYLFEKLCPGDYVVEVDEATLPWYLVPTIPNTGPDDLSDSELSPVLVTLHHGNEWNLTIDFGYIECNGKIGDYLWIDTNLNGIQDLDEPGIPGVRVILKGGNGISETLTNSTGYYLFESLCPGDYVVEVDNATLPPNLIPTIPNAGPDDLSDSELSPVLVTLHHGNEWNLTIDFGYIECNGRIGDYLWIDTNLNGIQDEDGSSGIPGVRVILRDDDRISETRTNLTGYYLFENLCPGNYTVDVDESTLPPTVMGPTILNVGPDDSIDSDGSLDGGPVPVTLTADKLHDRTIDFGYVECNGTIGDYVWIDTNRDGLQDLGEPGIHGVRVILSDGNGISETRTNSTGYYLFENLCPGNYTVDVDESTLPPTVMGPTIPNVGPDDSIDSDGSLYGGQVTVTITADKLYDLTIDFGYIECNGSIGDYVWNDSSRNGIQDLGEPGLPGVRVILKNGTAMMETYTNEGGYYIFRNLCPGYYTLDLDKSTLPFCLRPTTQNVGFDGSIDSDGPLDGGPVPVTLTANKSHDLTIDFGYVECDDGNCTCIPPCQDIINIYINVTCPECSTAKTGDGSNVNNINITQINTIGTIPYWNSTDEPTGVINLTVQRPEASIDAVLAFDVSGSMRLPYEGMGEEDRAAFAEANFGNVSVIGWDEDGAEGAGSGADLLMVPPRSLRESRVEFLAAIANLSRLCGESDQTVYAAGLHGVLEVDDNFGDHFSGDGKIALFITGPDEFRPGENLSDLATELKRRGYAIYPIGVAIGEVESPLMYENLSNIANITGGRFYPVGDLGSVTIRDVLRNVSAHASSRAAPKDIVVIETLPAHLEVKETVPAGADVNVTKNPDGTSTLTWTARGVRPGESRSLTILTRVKGALASDGIGAIGWAGGFNITATGGSVAGGNVINMRTEEGDVKIGEIV